MEAKESCNLDLRGEKEGGHHAIYGLVSEVTQQHICHILLVRNELLQTVHTQKEENWAPPFGGRSVEEFLENIFATTTGRDLATHIYTC